MAESTGTEKRSRAGEAERSAARSELRANVAPAQRPAGHALKTRAANDARALTTHVQRAGARLEPGVRSELIARPELVDGDTDLERVEADLPRGAFGTEDA